MKKITLHSLPGCPMCEMTRKYLRRQSSPFGGVDVSGTGAHMIVIENNGDSILPTHDPVHVDGVFDISHKNRLYDL